MSRDHFKAADYYADRLVLTDEEALDFTAPKELLSESQLGSGLRFESLNRGDTLLNPVFHDVHRFLYDRSRLISQTVENESEPRYRPSPVVNDITTYAKSQTEVLWDKKANRKLVTGKIASITIQAVHPELLPVHFKLETPTITERERGEVCFQDIADNKTDSYYLINAETKVGRFAGNIACGVKMKSRHGQFSSHTDRSDKWWSHQFDYEMIKLDSTFSPAKDTAQSITNARLHKAWRMAKPLGGMRD